MTSPLDLILLRNSTSWVAALGIVAAWGSEIPAFWWTNQQGDVNPTRLTFWSISGCKMHENYLLDRFQALPGSNKMLKIKKWSKKKLNSFLSHVFSCPFWFVCGARERSFANICSCFSQVCLSNYHREREPAPSLYYTNRAKGEWKDDDNMLCSCVCSF